MDVYSRRAGYLIGAVGLFLVVILANGLANLLATKPPLPSHVSTPTEHVERVPPASTLLRTTYRYHVVPWPYETAHADSVEQHLDQAGAHGYRVVSTMEPHLTWWGSKRNGAILMERIEW